MNKVILIILLFVSSVPAQRVIAFSRNNVEYSVETKVQNNVATTRATILGGEYDGWYAEDVWKIDCKRRMFAHTDSFVFNKASELKKSSKGTGEEHKVQPNSFGDVAFSYWCK